MAHIAAHAAALAQAIKASGSLVSVEPAELVRIVGKQDAPLVVRARSGLFKKRWQYLTAYKGLAFFSVSDEPLLLPGRTEIIEAREIWMPS